MSAELAIKAQVLRDIKQSALEHPEDVDDYGSLELVIIWPDSIDDANAEGLWDNVINHPTLGDWANEALSEFRHGGEEITGVLFGDTYSRHYEADRVACKLEDGRWVGWIYWHGGGKHGAPGEIEWISDAVFLNCVEEQKLVTVRTYSLLP